MRIAVCDPEELAVRMCEASYGLKRPTPDAKEALAAMEPECREGWLRAARIALIYMGECIADAQRVQ